MIGPCFQMLPWDHRGQVWRVQTENGTAVFFDFTGPASLWRREPMCHASGRINTLGEGGRWAVLGYGPWGVLPNGHVLDEPPSLGTPMIYGRAPRESIRSTVVVDIRLAGDDVPPCDLPIIEERNEYDPADDMSGWMVWAGAELNGLRTNGPTRKDALIAFAAKLDAHLDRLARSHPGSRVGRWWGSRVDEHGDLLRFLSEHLEVEAND